MGGFFLLAGDAGDAQDKSHGITLEDEFSGPGGAVAHHDFDLAALNRVPKGDEISNVRA
jgi:hypothetical protein